MDHVQIIFILLCSAVLLIGLAQKIHVPYPIALVLGGVGLGFVPGLDDIFFDPNIILEIVLPPILYYAAFTIPFREFKNNWKDIFSLALGLVIFTTIVIGVLFKALFPQFPWALAFAFGAIVSPPDAVATTAILRRLSISPRLISLLEGESLINDASAIVLYRVAILALLSGTFYISDAALFFAQEALGGIAVGFVLGYAFQLFSRRYLEPVLGVVFSFTLPYLTYIIANLLGVSGVLAVVVNGLIGASIVRTHRSSLRRVLGFAGWDIFNILMNCFVFILIGLQLRILMQVLTLDQALLYSGYALLISFFMVLVRMFWVYSRAALYYFRYWKRPKSAELCPQVLREAAIISWSGMRGIVSLAVALALPIPLDGRSEIIFISFVVILISLLVPGLTLPMFIRWLKIPSHHKHDDRKIRKQLVDIAEENLKKLFDNQKISDSEYNTLINYFISHHRVLEMNHLSPSESEQFEKARLKVIQSQRKKLFEMWELLEIDDNTLGHMQSELDMVEVHVARAELN